MVFGVPTVHCVGLVNEVVSSGPAGPGAPFLMGSAAACQPWAFLQT